MKLTKNNSLNIWGVKFNLLRLEDFVELVNSRLRNNDIPIHITGVNPETVVHASRNELMREAIQESDYVNVDNALIVLTLRLLGYKVPERVSTPDLFEALLKLAAVENYSVYILGAKAEILQTAIENIRKDYPNLLLESQHGYYSRDNEKSVINHINDFKPDMLFIALPSPKKESFILKYKNNIQAKLFLGVGGAIDCRAGVVKRPPKALGKLGLEGIIRSLQNPLNYGKRYLTFYPVYFKIVIKSLFNKNNNND